MSRPTCSVRLLPALLLASGLALPAPAARAPVPACEGGSFAVEMPEEALVPGSAIAPPDAIVVGGGGSVAIASGCPEVAGKLRGSRKGTRLSAKWTKKKGLCAGLEKKASLKARFDPSCETISGTFRTKGVKREFLARRGTLEIGAGNAEIVAAQLARAAARAAADVIAALPPAPAGAPGAQPLPPTEIQGALGRASATGLRIGSPKPPRYELSLVLDGYAADAGEAQLTGALEYNFIVVEEQGEERQYGLLRGSVTLAGSFAGAADVHASVKASASVAASVTAASGTFLTGEGEPPPFLSWVTTVAGGNGEGFEDGGPRQARFSEPTGVAVDDDGHVYVADSGNGAIREIAPDGTVSTLVEGMKRPWDLGIDADGNLVASDRLSSPKPGDAPLLRVLLKGPSRGATEPIVGGDELLCNTIFGTCDGRSPMAGLPYGGGIDVGAVTIVAQWELPVSLRAVLPDGFVTTIATGSPSTADPQVLTQPDDVAVGRLGEIYFTSNTHEVRVRRPDGSYDTLAGQRNVSGDDDGPGPVATLSSPRGIVYDGLRTLYVAEWSGWVVRQVDAVTGETRLVAGCRPPICEGARSGLADGEGELARFDSPENLVLDRYGDLWVGDGDNHAIRLIRIIADPDRTPEIVDFTPHAVQQGETARVVVRGRNLATTASASLGAGVRVTLLEASHREAVLSVAVAAGAEVGERTLNVATAYGAATAGPGLGFSVLPDDRGGATVETMAGTGSLVAAAQDVLPGPLTAFALPTGLFAESGDRLLVADPYAQQIRLVATPLGIVAEIVDLITASALGADVNALDAVLGGLGSLGSALETLGIRQAWTDNAQDAIRDAAEQAVAAVCEGEDCEWMSMPWAGVPFTPGEKGGFRMGATFRLPADVYRANASTYYVADTGNDRLRIVGYDPEEQESAVNEVFSLDRFNDFPFSVATGPAGYLVPYASLPEGPLLGRVDVEMDDLLNQWAGDRRDPRCEQREGSPWPPIGIPIGMAGDDDALWVADPYCKTVWRVEDTSGVAHVRDVRSEAHVEAAPKCADGPVAFATFGAPVDVAVLDGVVWVADAGCHSIRTIRARGADPAAVAAGLSGFLESNAARIGEETAAKLQDKLDALDTDFLEQNRWWVTTVAGSTDGVAGFADGPAAEARFRYPTGIAAESFDGGTRVFVADTGNRRLRMIFVP